MSGSARYIIGDSLTVLRSMPDASVDLVLTSPPFLALRSYLPADHPDKAYEIGSEPTPGEFIDTLLDLTEEWRRVLAPHGSIAIELGDTYSGSGGAGGDYGTGGLRDGQAKFRGSALADRKNKVLREDGNRLQQGPGWPDAKSLCLIPESYRWALVYGRNPFTGRETPRWRARNVVRWHRPNPPVGALGDKFRPATSDIIIACTDRKRYFDLDAVRTPSDYDRPNLRGNGSRGPDEDVPGQRKNHSDHTVNPAGAPPLDTWVIPTEPYKGSHYATWPTALLTRPILAMCPQRVCQTCGKPSERIVGETEYVRGGDPVGDLDPWPWDGGGVGVGKRGSRKSNDGGITKLAPTLGWTDCGHDDWRPGVVLDPFAGSGTTLVVATGHGRDAIGIDLDERNADLARERVGMWLTVKYHVDSATATA